MRSALDFARRRALRAAPAIAIVAVALTGGCAGDPDVSSKSGDASPTDTSSDFGDVAFPDVPPTDATAGDAGSDASSGDATATDATTGDTSASDATTFEATSSDATTVETTSGDATAGDSASSDTSSGDATTAEGSTDGATSDGTVIDATTDVAIDAPEAVCGDGVKNGAEECDGTDLGGATCTSVYGATATGSLACDATCKFIPTSCRWCGDGDVTGTEVCDGTNLNFTTCGSLLSWGSTGTLACAATCASFDVSGCVCGDGRSLCMSPTPACVDEVNDDDNCGACGNVCPTGSTCAGSHCTTIIATGLVSAMGVSVDATNLYWATAGDGNVWSVPLAGGTAGKLITSGLDSYGRSTLPIGGQLIVSGYNSGDIFDVPIGGGAETSIVTGESVIESITTDGTHLYWVDWSKNTVRRSSLTGTNVTTLTSGAPQLMTPDTIITDGTWVYWGNEGGAVGTASIYRCKTDGTSVGPVVATGINGGVYPMAVDATTLYFATNLDLAIYTVPIAGGTPTKLVTTSAVPAGIAIDASSVYWTDATNLWKVAKTGGSITQLSSYNVNIQKLAPYSNDFADIALTATRVYWSASGTQYGNGAVFSVAKN